VEAAESLPPAAKCPPPTVCAPAEKGKGEEAILALVTVIGQVYTIIKLLALAPFILHVRS